MTVDKDIFQAFPNVIEKRRTAPADGESILDMLREIGEELEEGSELDPEVDLTWENVSYD